VGLAGSGLAGEDEALEHVGDFEGVEEAGGEELVRGGVVGGDVA
jgi:hypothetical protein